MNGTSRKGLRAQHSDVLEAIEALHAALRWASPHGRDYQTMHERAWSQAHNQHVRRLALLQEIKEEHEAILMHLHD